MNVEPVEDEDGRILAIKVHRHELKNFGIWQADSCSGIAYNMNEKVKIMPSTVWKVVE